MMEPYLAQLDPNRNAMGSFVKEYYSRGSVDINTLTWPEENRGMLNFELNEEHTGSRVAHEVNGPLMDEFRFLSRMPVFPEVTEPIFTRCLQGWTKHVIDGTIDQSWSGCWTAQVMIHLYRQLTPTKFQTREYMQLVYAVVVAFDIQTTCATMVDDMLDGTKDRDGEKPWHENHPLTFPTDLALQTAVGKQILRYILPDSHPFKRDILDMYDDYVCYCASYLTVTGARKETGMSQATKDAVYCSLDEVTTETTRAFNWMRAGVYLVVLYDVPCLLSCYGNMLHQGPRRKLYQETIARALASLCTLDDIRDTKAFEVSFPWGNKTRAALHDYLPYVNDDMLQEFAGGDPHHAFLMAGLELGRSTSTDHEFLKEDEKVELMSTLRECYWPNPQEVPEGPDAKDKRLRLLCALFLKYDIRSYVKDHVLSREIKCYLAVHDEVGKALNMPGDVLSYLMGTMVCGERTTRPAHVAEGMQATMDKPMSEMDEASRLQKMFALVAGI